MSSERFDYRAAVNLGLREEHLGPELWREYKAIELAEVALGEIPWFGAQFRQRGTSIDNIMSGINTMDSMLKAVLVNCRGRKRGQMVQAWGQRILKYAQNGDVTGMNGCHQRAAEFVLGNKEIFKVEISTPTV